MGSQTTAARVARDDKSQVAALLQQAAKAFQAGKVDRLAAILDQVLEIDPDNTTALYNRGILHRDCNELFGAEVCFRRVMTLDPEMIDAYQALADLLFKVKHLLPATRIYEDALERAPNRLPLLHNLARTRVMLKEAAATETLARRILSIDDRSVEAINDLAWALLYRNGDLDEVLQLTARALEIAPDSPHAIVLRERALERAGRSEEARSLWARILEVCAFDWEKSRPYCEAYYWLDEVDRCRDIVMAYVAANPNRPDGLKDLATLMMGDGEFAQAQEILNRVAGIAPDNQNVRMVRGLNAFRLGDYRLGLDLYDARWHRDSFDKPWDIPVPEWDGKKIDGRLIVYSEQGIGDYAMFALLFPELRKYAKSVTIEVNPRMASLFRRSFPDMRVIDRNGLPADWNPAAYAAKVAMGDLALRLGVDMENLPNREGFLVPEPGMAAKLRERYQALFPGKRLVGISWRSGNRDSATIRSVDLSLLTPVFETPDCAFISLQYGDVTRDLETLRAETGHQIYWDKEIDPLAVIDPVVAQIAAMDLVISVDNSTVHMAGAIGKPCWVMLPVNADWRWLLDRPTSIWYDSLELFRQRPGDGWTKVIERVAAKLKQIGTASLVDAHARMCLRCGEEFLRRGMMAPAEAYFRSLLATGRHAAAAMHGIGLAAQRAGHFSDAAAILGRAAELAPDRLDYRAEWAVALFDSGHRSSAEKMARELSRQSDAPTVQMAMGQILAARGAIDQATDYFARVLRTDPNHVIARFVLANLQAAQGEVELARRNYARLIEVAPDLPAARAALAELDLKQGNDHLATQNFAWRFGATPEELPPHLAMMAPADRPKSWNGGQIRRRRLFLRAERNSLEQLVFAPWLNAIADDCRSITAECDPAVLPLLQTAFPDVAFAPAGSLAPADLVAARCQLAASLGDLAIAFERGAPERAPSAGWMPHDRAAAATRRSEYLGDAGGKVVGLAWKVTDTQCHGLEPFAPLLAIPGIRWVALPSGPRTPALERFIASLGEAVVYDPAAQSDMLHLRDHLAPLDLLIAADDLIATLGEALGRPVWKLCAGSDHWSWRAAGTASKWHPGARIFRIETTQPAEAFEALREALAQEVGAYI
jgi:tetratricopeptide (TPR) repeat protein